MNPCVFSYDIFGWRLGQCTKGMSDSEMRFLKGARKKTHISSLEDKPLVIIASLKDGKLTSGQMIRIDSGSKLGKRYGKKVAKVKENQEKDKIGSKPDKNGKRVSYGKINRTKFEISTVGFDSRLEELVIDSLSPEDAGHWWRLGQCTKGMSDSEMRFLKGARKKTHISSLEDTPQVIIASLKDSKLTSGQMVELNQGQNWEKVSKNNLVYFKAIPRDGIYEIDMSCPNTNDSSMAKDLLGLIHIDVCGPFKIVSRQGANYFVTFTDDFSRYGYVYLLKHKHEVFETFKVFQKEVENQLGKTIKSLRSDREGEYMSQEFLNHLKGHGIISHRTPPYTPQHNGVSKRRNRTLLDMVRSMMSQTTLPKSFWDYALETVARILNMVPTKKVDKTPYEVWHGQAPKLPSENKVFVARNAEFFESKLLDLKASGSVEDLELIQEEDTNPSVDTSLDHEEDGQEIDEPQSDINPIRKSSRTRRVPDRMCLYIDAEEHELGDLGEPANNKAALLDPESKKWLDAMNVEMQSMKDNDGFTQTYGVDYEETFSPVADIRAIRILIAIAAYYDYEIWQMDVKTAFLNGHLFEEVYMKQHEGFVNPKYPNHNLSWKLVKTKHVEKQDSTMEEKKVETKADADKVELENEPLDMEKTHNEELKAEDDRQERLCFSDEEKDKDKDEDELTYEKREHVCNFTCYFENVIMLLHLIKYEDVTV
nr:hypothetical protein [Tanacetum cinerariifolium]